MSEVAIVASPPPNCTVHAIVGQAVPPDRIKEALEHPDALRAAYYVGVLEILSIGLTVLGIVIALAAGFGFWMIRGAAVRAAREAAKEEIKVIAAKQAKEWIEEHAKGIIAQSALAVAGSSTPTIAIDPTAAAEVIESADELKP